MTGDISNKTTKLEKDIEYIKEHQTNIENVLNSNQKRIEKKLDSFINDVYDKLRHYQEEQDKKIRLMRKEVEKHYAAKYVENAFWWMLATTGTAIVSILLYLSFGI